MENKTNSAIRLNKIIQKAYTNDNKIIADVWKNIFDINISCEGVSNVGKTYIAT